jgi:hypothetical protein
MATTTNFALKKPASTDLVDSSGAPADLNGNADTIDANLGQDGLFWPGDSGLLGQTQPLEYTNANGLAMTTQLFYVAAIRCNKVATTTGIICGIRTAAGTTGRTHSQIALYGPTGTKLGATTDGTSSSGIWTTGTGCIKIAWASTFSTVQGVLYALLWDVSTASLPAFLGLTTTPSNAAAHLNDPVTQGSSNIRRWGSFSAGSSSAVPASLTVSSSVVTIGGQTPTNRADVPYLALY